jgi:hypothetical protein
MTQHAAEWEYRTVKIATTGWFAGGKIDEREIDEQLNSMGRDQWELVAAFTTQQMHGQSRHVLFVFKRPRTDQRPPHREPEFLRDLH